MKKSYKAEEGGHYGTKMTVMQPTVENVSSENVASEENTEYDYMDAVGNMFNAICDEPEAKSDEEIINQIMKIKGTISEITSHVVQTGLFQDSEKRYIEFLDEILELPTKNERIKQAWLHFLTKINDAPTRIHMRSVVILCLPALNFVLNTQDKTVASEGLLCSSENYHDCDDYNTEFCRERCEFGPKEIPVNDVNLDNRENSK